MYQAQRKPFLTWFVIVCCCIVLFYLIYTLSSTLKPFITGIILAYFLNPLVTRLDRKMPRIIASLLVVTVVVILTLVFIGFLIPVVLQQLQDLFDKIPTIIAWIQHNIDEINLYDTIQDQLNIKELLDFNNLNNIWQQNSENIKSLILKISNYAKQTGSGIILLFYNLFMLPITLCYFLYIWPNLIEKITTLIPRKHHDFVMHFMHQLDVALSKFVHGQFLVMLVMGLIYGIGLAMVGLKHGFYIGFMTGMLVFIPYIGFLIGLSFAILTGILQYGNILPILYILIVFIVGGILESFVVTPKLIGDRIDLSPVLVILSLLVFSQLFGFVGVLLALPLSAVGVVVFKTIFKAYYKSKFYLEE